MAKECFKPASNLPTQTARQFVLSRRQFIQTLTAGGSVLAAGCGLDPGDSQDVSVEDLPDLSFCSVTDDALLMLINRTSFGYNSSAYCEAKELGYDAYLEAQLDPDGLDDPIVDQELGDLPALDMTAQQLFDTYYEDMQGEPPRQLIVGRILRAVFSTRQLFERMVEFWTDHFNIDINDDKCKLLKVVDDRDVIRKHAMGSFPELLAASAHSPAMLFYLDNFDNVAGHAQENYARELMELHSLGVNGGYTQEDVEELARVLTGWSITGENSGDAGQFIYKDDKHDKESKTVLGQTFPAGGGQQEGETMLEVLGMHPSTAAFISEKLCRHFIGYEPTQALIDEVSSTFLNSGGDIKAMLRVILSEDTLMAHATPKLKRPIHHIASLYRATNSEMKNQEFVSSALKVMGQIPFHWASPDGYADSLDVWGSSLLPRWQIAAEMLSGNVKDVDVDVDGLLEDYGSVSAGQEAAAMDAILTGGTSTQEQIDVLQSFFDEHPYDRSAALADTMGLAASMPSFQWY